MSSPQNAAAGKRDLYVTLNGHALAQLFFVQMMK